MDVTLFRLSSSLPGSTITLYRMSEEGVPTVKEFVEDKLPQGGVIGFDGRVLSSADGAAYAKIAEKKQGSLFVAKDLVNEIWTDDHSFRQRKYGF